MTNTNNLPVAVPFLTERCQALLDLLLNTMEENQVGLSNQDIREEINTFMFAVVTKKKQ